VFSWSKGVLYLKDRKMPYEIIDRKLYVGVVDYHSRQVEAYAVYEQIDNKEYKKEEIRVKDNTHIPFIYDEKVIGFYQAIDFVNDVQDFQPNKKYFKEELYLKSYTFNPNGTLMEEFNGRDFVSKINWSKNVVINKKESTVREYFLKEIDKETIMFVEWKSGDYVYGGKVKGYYVLKKIK